MMRERERYEHVHTNADSGVRDASKRIKLGNSKMWSHV